MIKLLSIAGSDPCGGAGIQADIKTITAHGMYAMSVITALTAQNTTGVYGIEAVPASFVARQLDCVFTDIHPDAVKIGMLGSAETIAAVSERLRFYKAERIVLDPVMISTSGRRLLEQDAAHTLVQELIPLAAVITPNLPEAEVLSGMPVRSEADMLVAAKKMADTFGTAVLLKGGHLEDAANDLLFQEGCPTWYRGKRIDNSNTHGTGCTLSSAIACGLAGGLPLSDSIAAAKQYLTEALAAGLNLGKGNGPLNHCCRIRELK